MKTATMATPMLKEFARRLLDCETAESNPSTGRVDVALRVCEKLRGSLAALSGVGGVRSLFVRALTLAKGEVPSLRATSVNEDGSLAMEVDPQLDKDEVVQGVVVVIANLIGLLVAFVGADLTHTLIREVWPEAGKFPKEEKNL